MANTSEETKVATRRAFARIRAGIATAADLELAEAWEARAKAVQEASRRMVRSVWDLPIAKRMWDADRREVQS